MATARRQWWNIIGVPDLTDSSFEVHALHSERIPSENVERVCHDSDYKYAQVLLINFVDRNLSSSKPKRDRSTRPRSTSQMKKKTMMTHTQKRPGSCSAPKKSPGHRCPRVDPLLTHACTPRKLVGVTRKLFHIASRCCGLTHATKIRTLHEIYGNFDCNPMTDWTQVHGWWHQQQRRLCPTTIYEDEEVGSQTSRPLDTKHVLLHDNPPCQQWRCQMQKFWILTSWSLFGRWWQEKMWTCHSFWIDVCDLIWYPWRSILTSLDSREKLERISVLQLLTSIERDPVIWRSLKLAKSQSKLKTHKRTEGVSRHDVLSEFKERRTVICFYSFQIVP